MFESELCIATEDQKLEIYDSQRKGGDDEPPDKCNYT
jgi:hypothetical protein